MSIKNIILLLPALALLVCNVAAQDQTKQDQTKDARPKTIEHVPLKQTSSTSGKEMFTSYCAVCHGTDGK